MVAAIQRDGRVWGHSLADLGKVDSTAQADTAAMKTLADGTVVISTTTLGKDISGYAGPVPLEVYLKDGKIVDIKALNNNETPEFFGKASQLLTRWNGFTPEEALNKEVDAVSGATFSSRAIIGNVRAALQMGQKAEAERSLLTKVDHSPKALAGLVVVLMAAIVPLFYRNKRYRTAQLVLNVVVLGLWCGTFLNWSVFVGYMSNGISLGYSLVPAVMLITAFVYPLFGKKNYYCTNVCPFGSVQDLAGKARRKKWKLGHTTAKRLGYFRQALFATLMVLMLVGVGFEWMDYEVFSAFIFQSAATVVIVMAVVFAVLAIFVPRPYCRFVCPTGTLLRLAEGGK